VQPGPIAAAEAAGRAEHGAEEEATAGGKRPDRAARERRASPLHFDHRARPRYPPPKMGGRCAR
jgi:hypothetical protein